MVLRQITLAFKVFRQIAGAFMVLRQIVLAFMVLRQIAIQVDLKGTQHHRRQQSPLF